MFQCYKTNSNKNTEFAAVKKGAKLETFYVFFDGKEYHLSIEVNEMGINGI